MINEIEKADKINIDNINDMIQDLSSKYNNDSSKEMTNEEEKKYYNEIIKNVESIFTDKNFDTTNLDNGKEQFIKIEKITITSTTSQSQKNKTNDFNNMMTLDLGGCEKDLREFYNISSDKLLYIKKMDVVQKGMKISKIEYSVYCKLNDINLIKLNLSVCENNKISLSVQIEITENLDKLNTSSDYFNSICYSSKSDYGTDISLKDRKKEFVENNKTVCQEDCLFADYNETIQKANCSCSVKESSDEYDNMNINKTKLYENFGDTNDKTEISNLGITSCNVLASKENIESNAGFFSLLIILAIFIIIFIIFSTKGYNNLENKIDEVIYKKFKNDAKYKEPKLNKNNKINNSLMKISKTKGKNKNQIKKK